MTVFCDLNQNSIIFQRNHLSLLSIIRKLLLNLHFMTNKQSYELFRSDVQPVLNVVAAYIFD